jgi:hypothetical protein
VGEARNGARDFIEENVVSKQRYESFENSLKFMSTNNDQMFRFDSDNRYGTRTTGLGPNNV